MKLCAKTFFLIILKFRLKFNPLLKWCKFNRMDINWSMTIFMIVTAKHKSKMSIPISIEIDSHNVAVTESFKLLGVIFELFSILKKGYLNLTLLKFYQKIYI